MFALVFPSLDLFSSFFPYSFAYLHNNGGDNTSGTFHLSNTVDHRAHSYKLFIIFRTYYNICYTCFLRLYADHHGGRRVLASVVFNYQPVFQRHHPIFGVSRRKCPLAGRRLGEASYFMSLSHRPFLLLLYLHRFGFKMSPDLGLIPLGFH